MTQTPSKPTTATGGPFALGPVRVAWPHLLAPKTRTNDQGKTTSKFEAVILVDKKDTALIETAKSAIRAAVCAALSPSDVSSVACAHSTFPPSAAAITTADGAVSLFVSSATWNSMSLKALVA